MASANIPDRPTRLRIGVVAECDERAVAKFYREPERVRPALRASIRRALLALGFVDPHAGVAL